MKDVVHHAREGQGSDPSAARDRLSQFIEAGHALCEAWNPALDRGYPGYLPSFDEFLAVLVIWYEAVKGGQEIAEDEDIRPVNFADQTDIRSWLKNLRAQVEDGMSAGEDATRPLGQRALGRLSARRTVLEARKALLELLQAAERGIG